MKDSTNTKKIGIISDTHGKLNPKVFEIFQQVDYILHAGDIGNEDILISLQAIAPTIAVYGNVDSFALRNRLTMREELSIDEFHIDITHIPTPLNKLTPAFNKKWEIKIFGHMHKASVVKKGTLLIINPGSASQPRDDPNPTVALLYLSSGREPKVEIIEL